MGEVGWRPTGSGWQWLYSVILTEVLIGQHVGTWKRIKQCSNKNCRATFYDRSWDQRETWHNARACGSA
jgi:predicted RNA-binding Zn ribbon-like protein